MEIAFFSASNVGKPLKSRFYYYCNQLKVYSRLSSTRFPPTNIPLYERVTVPYNEQLIDPSSSLLRDKARTNLIYTRVSLQREARASECSL